MRRLLYIATLLVFLLVSCRAVPETIKYNRNLNEKVFTSAVSSIAEEKKYKSEQSDINVPLPLSYGYSHSKDIFAYQGLTIDLSSSDNYNSGGFLFPQHSNTTDYNFDKYRTDTSSTDITRPNDVESDAIADRFLSAMMNNNYAYLEDMTGIGDYTGADKDSVFSFLDRITITGYNAKRLNTGAGVKYYSVELDISQSDNPRYPKGKSNWILEIPQYSGPATVTLFARPDEEGFYLADKQYVPGEDTYLDFTYKLLGWYPPANGYITPDDFDIDNLYHSTYHLMDYFGIDGGEGYTLSEVDSFISKAYGINSLPERSYRKWILIDSLYDKFLKDNKAGVFTCLGHGDNVSAFRHLGTKKNADGTTGVLVALYSDFAYMTIAKLIELTYEDNPDSKIPKLISVNTAYNSGFPPACYQM